MLNITLPYQHPFKDTILGMCQFVGGRSSLTLHARKDDYARDRRLSVYRDGVHIMSILDHTFGCMEEGTYELLSCGLPNDTLRIQERGSLSSVAAFLSVFQQTGDVEQSLDAFWNVRETEYGI